MLLSCLGVINCLLGTVPLSLVFSAICRRYHFTALQTEREFCQETFLLTWLSPSSEIHLPFQLQFRTQLLPALWIMLDHTRPVFRNRAVRNLLGNCQASFSHFPNSVAEVHWRDSQRVLQHCHRLSSCTKL